MQVNFHIKNTDSLDILSKYCQQICNNILTSSNELKTIRVGILSNNKSKLNEHLLHEYYSDTTCQIAPVLDFIKIGITNEIIDNTLDRNIFNGFIWLLNSVSQINLLLPTHILTIHTNLSAQVIDEIIYQLNNPNSKNNNLQKNNLNTCKSLELVINYSQMKNARLLWRYLQNMTSNSDMNLQLNTIKD